MTYACAKFCKNSRSPTRYRGDVPRDSAGGGIGFFVDHALIRRDAERISPASALTSR